MPFPLTKALHGYILRGEQKIIGFYQVHPDNNPRDVVRYIFIPHTKNKVKLVGRIINGSVHAEDDLDNLIASVNNSGIISSEEYGVEGRVLPKTKQVLNAKGTFLGTIEPEPTNGRLKRDAEERELRYAGLALWAITKELL